MAKPFLTYSQQITTLIQHKNLIISDQQKAVSTLEYIGYFSLIGGYKTPFINPMTRKYENSATFEDILALYEFDKNLRHLIFKYICTFESHMRQLASYAFCQIHGENQVAYLSTSSYNVTNKNQYQVQKLIKTLGYQANQNNDKSYLVHQRKTYKNVPLWVIMNTLTFGQLSHFYAYLPYNIQTDISKAFPTINEHELGKYLETLTLFRNVCAHNERLYCYRLGNQDFPDKSIHQKLGIPKKGSQYLQGKKDLFGLVIAFRYLLSKQDYILFKKELNKLIDAFCKNSGVIIRDDLLSMMGFPSNWNNITRYKL